MRESQLLPVRAEPKTHTMFSALTIGRACPPCSRRFIRRPWRAMVSSASVKPRESSSFRSDMGAYCSPPPVRTHLSILDGRFAPFQGHESQGRPVSRILLYPAIHLRGVPGLPPGSCTYQPDAMRPDNLACSHRWFTWPVPLGIPPVGSYPTLSPITCAGQGRFASRPFRPSAGLLSVALDVTGGLHHPVPRVVGPSGLCYESGLCSTPGT